MKKTILSLVTLIGFSQAQAIQLNAPENLNELEAHIIDSLTMGENIGTKIENIKQVADSDNYMITIIEGEQRMVGMYIKDIDSLVINSSGDVLDLQKRKFLNKDYEAESSAPILKDIPREDLVTFKSENEVDQVYVFTDPTCPYCRKLHDEIGKYNEMGITVHYLPYPRGNAEGAHRLLVDAYCADNRGDAFTKMKSDIQNYEFVNTKSEEELTVCSNLVTQYFELGNTLGVKGTPAIYTETGHQIGGFIPAAAAKRAIISNK